MTEHEDGEGGHVDPARRHGRANSTATTRPIRTAKPPSATAMMAVRLILAAHDRPRAASTRLTRHDGDGQRGRGGAFDAPDHAWRPAGPAGANHTPRLSMSKASSRSTSGAAGTGAWRSAAVTRRSPSCFGAEELLLVLLHPELVPGVLAPGHVGEGEQEEDQQEERRGAEPRVEPPAEEGEDRRGHRELHGDAPARRRSPC